MILYTYITLSVVLSIAIIYLRRKKWWFINFLIGVGMSTGISIILGSYLIYHTEPVVTVTTEFYEASEIKDGEVKTKEGYHFYYSDSTKIINDTISGITIRRKRTEVPGMKGLWWIGKETIEDKILHESLEKNE